MCLSGRHTLYGIEHVLNCSFFDPAFFRSIFRVLPLLLVLSPANSSSCVMGNKTTEIRVKYENILSHDIDELVGNSSWAFKTC